MRIILVNMPWATTDVPSLALGAMTTRVHDTFPHDYVETIHANLEYVDWAAAKIGLDRAEYFFFADESYFIGCGDWIFSSALYDDRGWRVEEFTEKIAPTIPKNRVGVTRTLHELAPDAIEHLVSLILDSEPDVVGFTSTFQQNTASLAAAKRIKQLAPAVKTVMGGANCDGDQGSALHRNFAFLDFVVRGEGEDAFPALLGALRAGTPMTGIPGLCHRTEEGDGAVNPMATRPLPPGRIARPDYTGYFERFAASMARAWHEPKLPMESSRGCWWGEKHHCTFCGLNGSTMDFRGKDPAVFLDEIMDLVRRHQVLDIVVVDNILDMGYLGSLMPALKELGYDLRIHYEIKANMRKDKLQALRDAGVIVVQPGIENLSTRVLKLMDKGVTGCHNIRLMRDAESLGISVAWNYLHGFPGEQPADYLPIIEQFPALHHLAPPTSSSRIGLERFSPYFSRPELGFTTRWPATQYSVTYDLPEAELNDLAYLFYTPDRGIQDAMARRLTAAIGEWADAHTEARLTQCDLGSEIVLVSSRPGFDWTVQAITEPAELHAFRLLEQPRTPAALAKELAEGFSVAAPDRLVSSLLPRWQELGILFTEDGRYINVAPAATNGELIRLEEPALRSRGE
jgi:ribosomal peptide maturation radical SAM protein 1